MGVLSSSSSRLSIKVIQSSDSIDTTFAFQYYNPMISKPKKKLAWLLVLIGSTSFIYFSSNIFLLSLVEHTVEHSHEILGYFKRTTSFVDNFKNSNHRLPTQEEINKQFSEEHQVLLNNDLRDDNTPDFIKSKPEDTYFLSYWRGEWPEYYAAWNQKTTLVFDRNHFYPFNSKLLTILATGVSFALFCLGFILIRSSKSFI